jgi:hypothetical protein
MFWPDDFGGRLFWSQRISRSFKMLQKALYYGDSEPNLFTVKGSTASIWLDLDPRVAQRDKLKQRRKKRPPVMRRWKKSRDWRASLLLFHSGKA